MDREEGYYTIKGMLVSVALSLLIWGIIITFIVIVVTQ